MVFIESKVTLNRICNLAMAPDFTTHEHYRSIFTKKDTLGRIIGREGSVTIAHLKNTTIVGFAALDYPDSKERWADLDQKAVMALKAVEVSRQVRHHGIAKHLLSHLFTDPDLEMKIVYLSAYSWTWDLKYSRLSPQSYRNMLMNLYRDFGFKEYPTNEPNVCLKPENIFMARIGKKVSQKVREDFKWLRFGIQV
jgi:acetoin utilization protein AcuA